MLEATLLLGCLTRGMDPALALSIVDELSAREPNAVIVGRVRHDGTRHEGVREGGVRDDGATAVGIRDGRRPAQRLVTISADEAAALASGLVGTGDGDAAVRVGLMGVDTTRLASLDVGLDEAFDPCTNLALGERLYLEALEAATASGLSGEVAARAALRDYLGDPGAGPVGGDAVEAVRARRPASERWLAAHRPSAVPVRPRDGSSGAGREDDPSPATVRSGSSIVAWTPRAVTPRAVPAPTGRSGEGDSDRAPAEAGR